MGDPDDPATQMGPLAMERQRDRVEGYIAKGSREGATLRGRRRPTEAPRRGYYFEPTLFANVDNTMTIAQEEIFGPVICLIPVEDEEDAIRIANESHVRPERLGADQRHGRRLPRRAPRPHRLRGPGRIAYRLPAPYGGFKQLWPISRGKNLGYGGTAPLLSGSVVLDLCRMKKIEFDEQFGTSCCRARRRASTTSTTTSRRTTCPTGSRPPATRGAR